MDELLTMINEKSHELGYYLKIQVGVEGKILTAGAYYETEKPRDYELAYTEPYGEMTFEQVLRVLLTQMER